MFLQTATKFLKKTIICEHWLLGADSSNLISISHLTVPLRATLMHYVLSCSRTVRPSSHTFSIQARQTPHSYYLPLGSKGGAVGGGGDTNIPFLQVCNNNKCSILFRTFFAHRANCLHYITCYTFQSILKSA